MEFVNADDKTWSWVNLLRRTLPSWCPIVNTLLSTESLTCYSIKIQLAKMCVKCKDSYHTDKYRCKAQDIKQVFLLCIYFLLASIQQFYLGCFLTFLLCISCPLPSKVGMRNGSVSIKSLPGGFCCQNCLKVIAVMMERRD